MKRGGSARMCSWCQAHHKLYVEYHHRILAAIDKHIPVEEVMSIDEVACRLDKVQQEPAVAHKLAQNIKREIQSQVGECLTSSIGISANKLLAKLASNMQKPDGLVILPIEKLPGAILHLKIRAIPGIGPNMAERLRENGHHRYRHPLEHRRRAAAADLGRRGRRQDARASAWRRTSQARRPMRSSISHQHVLAPEDRSIEGAAPIMRQLLVRAAQRLRDDGFYCRRLIVEVKWLGRDRDSWTDKRSFSETQDTGMLLHVLQDIWQQVPNLKPLRVGVALTGLAAKEEHQPDLFDKPRNAKLVHAIDAVNEKFGKGALIYGDAAPDQTSKIAFQRVPKVKEF